MTAKDLKNALLQEAVQGKLVPQIASEGNARDLLEEIRKEKLSHGLDFANAKSGKRKSKKETALAGSNPCDITEDEIPFEIPESWCWCRVGDIFQHNTGKAMNSSAKEINKSGAIRKFITTSNLYWNEFDFTNVKEMFFSDDELPRCIVTKGDILINEGGAYFGRTAIWNYGYDICFQNHIHRLRPYSQIERKFFYYIFYLYRNTNRMQSKGTAMPGLSSEVLHSTIIPLAPLAEQKRIVAAIEKFMPLIEEYGKKETELKAFNEQIGALTKKAILQEAVQGKLVPQIAAEGNAKDLLEEIRKERLSHGFANSYGIYDGKNKKSKSSDLRSKSQISVTKKELPEITEDEIPFEIPENWCWCRLGEIVPFGVCQNAEPQEINDEDWILDLEDIEKDSGKILSFKTKKEVDSKSTKHIFKKGFVLYSKLRPYLNKCVIAPKDGFCTSEILPLDFGDMIYNKYAQLYLMSPFFVDYTNSLSFGVKMPRLGTEDGRKALFPLPPLSEQKRIVAAIEKLLPLCEKIGK